MYWNHIDRIGRAIPSDDGPNEWLRSGTGKKEAIYAQSLMHINITPNRSSPGVRPGHPPVPCPPFPFPWAGSQFQLLQFAADVYPFSVVARLDVDVVRYPTSSSATDE
jgi:hypothetical protein